MRMERRLDCVRGVNRGRGQERKVVLGWRVCREWRLRESEVEIGGGVGGADVGFQKTNTRRMIGCEEVEEEEEERLSGISRSKLG